MKRNEFRARLREQTDIVRVSSRLRQQTIEAAYRKEQKIMKKKFPVAILAAALSVLFCAAALAAASRAGMLDYYRLFGNTFVPENGTESIETDVLQSADDLIDFSLRELYYDGQTVRYTVDAAAKDEKIMLLGFDTFTGETWAALNRLNPSVDENDPRTIAEVFKEDGYTTAYTVSVGMIDPAEDSGGGSADYFYTEDGVLTFFLEETFNHDLAERPVEFYFSYYPTLNAAGKDIPFDQNTRVRQSRDITLTTSSQEEKAFVSAEPALFPSVGVQVDQLRVTVKPQELYVSIFYSVTDDNAFDRQVLHDDSLPAAGFNLTSAGKNLWFELIDPDSTAEAPYDQRLMSGLSDGRGGRISPDGETPRRYVLHTTLGLNELSDTYALRAFDAWTKERYETVTLSMREATEEDLAAHQFAEYFPD